MNFLYRILLTLNATSWLIVIYGIKDSWHIFKLSRSWTAAVLLGIPVILTIISLLLLLSKKIEKDSIEEAVEFEFADNDFLPVYLGYFFVALSINDCFTMLVVYLIVFIFTALTQAFYFNPLFLLVGFHYYYVTTHYGTRVFVAIRGQVVRNVKNLELSELRKVNDVTYFRFKRITNEKGVNDEPFDCQTQDKG